MGNGRLPVYFQGFPSGGTANMRSMDEERDRRIEGLLSRGVPKLRIAEELGITRETVSRVAARLGYPSRRRGKDMRDWAKIRSFYEAGNSAAETMRRFGFGASTWTAAIARSEINPRPRNYAEKPKGQTRAAVERLLNEGHGVAEIAERLGVSKADCLLPRPEARSSAAKEIRSSPRLGGNRADLRSRPVDAPVQGALRVLLGGLAGRGQARGHRSAG